MPNIIKPLVFNVIAECKTSKARASKMILPHGPVDTPVFMPVGTQVFIYLFLKIVSFWVLYILISSDSNVLGYFERNASRET